MGDWQRQIPCGMLSVGLGFGYLPLGILSGQAFFPKVFAYTRFPSLSVYQALKTSRYPPWTAGFAGVAFFMANLLSRRANSVVGVVLRVGYFSRGSVLLAHEEHLLLAQA